MRTSRNNNEVKQTYQDFTYQNYKTTVLAVFKEIKEHFEKPAGRRKLHFGKLSKDFSRIEK